MRAGGELSGTEARMQKLEQELGAADGKLEEQRNAAERLIKALETERDESRLQMDRVEERMQELERLIGAAQEQFRQKRETAVKTIRQMAAERDESRTQVGEVEERIRKVEEELTAAQEGLRAGTESGISPAGQQEQQINNPHGTVAIEIAQGPGAGLHELGGRRHSLAVEDEQHVVAGRRVIAVGRTNDMNRPLTNRLKDQAHVALTGVQRVSDGGRRHERD